MSSPTPTVVLIVEDDEGIGGGLVQALSGEGYAPLWCHDAAEALADADERVDLVILDLGLPDMEGLELCRELRSRLTQTPILILTARSTETDVVVGLDAGADDYLVKPFRLAELLARLRALVRRTGPGRADDRMLSVGDVTVDTAARRVYRDDREIELRTKEFDLLVVLMRNAGAVVSREDVMALVWDEHWFGSTKTLDVHMAALRQRLGEDGPTGGRITTLRGVGYRYELSVPVPIPKTPAR